MRVGHAWSFNGARCVNADSMTRPTKRPRETLTLGQVVVERVLVGAFMTALDMAGWSLSLLVLDDLRVCRLDAPTRARPNALPCPASSYAASPAWSLPSCCLTGVLSLMTSKGWHVGTAGSVSTGCHLRAV